MPRPLARSSRPALALALLLPALALTSTGASPAVAAGPTPTTTDGPHLYASTYYYTGTEQTFTVPEGVSQVQVKAVGAAGGDAGGFGGRGAVVEAPLPVTTGQTLYVWVGSPGGPAGAGGWNGGGQGGQSDTKGGGGGGASDVRTCPASTCDSRHARVLVAAGGGGAGAGGEHAGGDADEAGSSPSTGRGTAGGGGAGTASAGGAGGVASPSDQGEYAGYGAPGTFSDGGNSIRVGGLISFAGGGGGGGGVYGGGGGAILRFYGGGGGGGSSLVPTGGVRTTAARGTAASVTISYDLGPVTEMRMRAADGVLVATGADTRVITATARTDGGARIAGIPVSFSSSDPGQSFGPTTDHGDGTYSATLTASTTAGTATITARAAGTTSAADVLGTLDVVSEGYAVTVAPVAKTLVATGTDTTTVTATAESASGKRLNGLDVSFATTDTAQSIGPVTTGGNGTYTATLTGSTTVGSATVAPVVTGAGSPTLTGRSVTTEGYTVSVAAVTRTLVATGHDTATVTATAETTSGARLGGLDVSFASTDSGQSFGAVTAGGNGTYTATLTGSTTVGSATVTPVVTGAGSPTRTGTSVVTEGYSVTVAPVARKLVATGRDSATLTATAETTSGVRLNGLDVSFTTTGAGQSVGAATPGANGTYTATLSGSATPGSATVAPVVTGAGTPTLTGTSVVTEGYTVTVSPVADPLVGTGWDTTPLVATAETESGVRLNGLAVSFASTDADQSFGPVTAAGNGTYTTRLTGSTTVGDATVSPVVTGSGNPTRVGATVSTEGYTVTVQPMPERLMATGTTTRTVLARAQSASGRDVPDLQVSFASSDPGQRFGSVSDRGDGTYSARLTSSKTPGPATISVAVAGSGAPWLVPAILTSDAYAAPWVTATLSSAATPKNGWYRTPVTVTFACGGSMPLTTACPTPVVVATEGRDQVVTQSVIDSLGTVGSATSPGISIDTTAPALKVTGVKKRGTYKKAPKVACRATDALSGVASCKVTSKRTKKKSKKGTRVQWTAVAIDRAGNTTRTTGTYTIRPKGKRR